MDANGTAALNGDSKPAALKIGDVTKEGVTLPHGYIDEKNELHDHAELREITGEEEDILGSSRVTWSERFSRIMGNCLVKVGTITEKNRLLAIPTKLPVGDRVVMLLALRIMSLGAQYEFEVVCSVCGAMTLCNIALDDLELCIASDKKLRETTLTLPSGKRAVVKLMTGEDEARLAKSSPERDLASVAILARLKSLNDKDRIGMAEVKALSMRDRNMIRDWYQNAEAGVDTDINANCIKCGKAFKTELDIGQPGFFFPKASEAKTASL